MIVRIEDDLLAVAPLRDVVGYVFDHGAGDSWHRLFSGFGADRFSRKGV